MRLGHTLATVLAAAAALVVAGPARAYAAPAPAPAPVTARAAAALPKPHFAEICPGNGSTCIQRPDLDHNPAGLRVKVCSPFSRGCAPGIDWSIVPVGRVGTNGFEPFKVPNANRVYKHDIVARIYSAPRRRVTQYCLSTDPAQVHGGPVVMENCRRGLQNRHLWWVFQGNTPVEGAWVLGNVYAINADHRALPWVMTCHLVSGDHVFSVLYGSVALEFQIWSEFPVPVRKTAGSSRYIHD